MRPVPLLFRYRRLRSRLRSLRRHFSAAAPNRIEKRTDFRRCERPVLLVYGFMATRRSFEVMEARLRRDGYCVFSIDLGGFRGTFNSRSIDELARLVEAKVEGMYARYRLGPLTIVGHSKGGLIGAHYVKHLGGHRRTRALITLGTPHNGTPLAYLGLLIAPIARSAPQMTPLSPFVRRLARTPMPGHVHFASIWSRQDAVCPHPAAVLRDRAPNVHNVEVVAPHHELLLRKRVYDAVRAQLRAAEAWARASVGPVREARRAGETTPGMLHGTLGFPV